MTSALKKYVPHLLLTAIILPGAALRTPEMNLGLWYDEMLTHQIAIQPISEAFHHGLYPLTYLLAHFALKIADNEVMLRLHSFLAGILGIWLIYFMGKAWHSRRAGLIASFLLSISSAHIYYSQEARYYSLLALASIILFWAVRQIQIQPRQPKYWALLLIATAIGSLTHLFFLPFLLCTIALSVATALLSKKSSIRNKIATTTALAIPAVLGLAPWLAIANTHRSNFTPSKLLEANTHNGQHYLLDPSQYLDFCSQLLHMQSPEQSTPMFLMIAAGAIALATRIRLTSLPIIGTLILLPLPLFFIPVSHFYIARYFITLLPPALLLIAILLVDASHYTALAIQKLTKPSPSNTPAQPPHPPIILPSIILLIAITTLTTCYLAKNLNANHFRDKWRDYAQLMAPYVSPDDIVIHFAPYQLNPGTKNKPMPWPDYALKFYLDRLLINNRGDLQPHRTFLTINPADVDHWLRQYPQSNIWLIHWRSTPIIRLTPAQDKLFQTLLPGWSEIFQLAAAPTTNLIAGADFESKIQPHLQARLDGNTHIIPDESDPQSHYLHLGPSNHNTTSSAYFQIKNTTPAATATSVPTVLSPQSQYILSFKLKYHNAPGDADTTGAVQVKLHAATPNHQATTIPLANYYWSSPWQFHSIPLRPADYPEIYKATSLQLEFAYAAPTGSMSVDNIQFEAGKHPTPYVNGTRLPHDQSLDRITESLK